MSFKTSEIQYDDTKTEWTSQELTLINEVKNNTYIHDSIGAFVHWKNISRTIGITPQECQSRWKSIMSCYYATEHETLKYHLDFLKNDDYYKKPSKEIDSDALECSSLVSESSTSNESSGNNITRPATISVTEIIEKMFANTSRLPLPHRPYSEPCTIGNFNIIQRPPRKFHSKSDSSIRSVKSSHSNTIQTANKKENEFAKERNLEVVKPLSSGHQHASNPRNVNGHKLIIRPEHNMNDTTTLNYNNAENVSRDSFQTLIERAIRQRICSPTWNQPLIPIAEKGHEEQLSAKHDESNSLGFTPSIRGSGQEFCVQNRKRQISASKKELIYNVPIVNTVQNIPENKSVVENESVFEKKLHSTVSKIMQERKKRIKLSQSDTIKVSGDNKAHEQYLQGDSKKISRSNKVKENIINFKNNKTVTLPTNIINNIAKEILQPKKCPSASTIVSSFDRKNESESQNSLPDVSDSKIVTKDTIDLLLTDKKTTDFEERIIKLTNSLLTDALLKNDFNDKCDVLNVPTTNLVNVEGIKNETDFEEHVINVTNSLVTDALFENKIGNLPIPKLVNIKDGKTNSDIEEYIQNIKKTLPIECNNDINNTNINNIDDNAKDANIINDKLVKIDNLVYIDQSRNSDEVTVSSIQPFVIYTEVKNEAANTVPNHVKRDNNKILAETTPMQDITSVKVENTESEANENIHDVPGEYSFQTEKFLHDLGTYMTTHFSTEEQGDLHLQIWRLVKKYPDKYKH